MIISEVNAVFDLVLKATSFSTELKDGWYKGCSELNNFQNKVLMLSAKHSQWSEQLQRYGVFEDKHLLLLVKLAEQALDKQQELIRKLQRSPFSRLKKRVFPGEISDFLDEVLRIVDAGPQLLATKVANSELLERYAAQTPTPLPFGRDRNYVPIVNTILEVQRALESADAARVVTVHGGPGMGKSCLAKHVAIHYVEEKQRLQMDASAQQPAVFPDGVYYLFCGRQADKRIKQLQLELLQSLGFQTADTAPIDSATSSGIQEGYTPLPTHHMKLRSRLAEQKLLIILDDLWEETVLQKFLVPAKGVKYLITSQMRDIVHPAEKIQIGRPTDVEARNIMANYTDGLPIPGQFPLNIQTVADDIIQKLEHHPLSLASIGISINSSRATDTNQWKVISANLHLHLDENDRYRPSAYDRAYSLPVSASMMLMVESQQSAEALRLLYLMTLLGGGRLPEPLVKYFYKFYQKTGFAVKYYSHEKYLEDKSLIENFTVGENMSVLDCHSLRQRYIRDNKTHEVRSLASQISIASGSQDVAKPIEKGDTEETLVTVLGGIYYDPCFKDIIHSTLENHVKVLNGGVIPRSLNILTDTCDYAKSDTEELVWLLNVDRHEAGDWKNQAHEYAKKIIIKFACQGKLDDDSMASLLKHPQTTSVACKALRLMSWCHMEDFRDHNITFSSAYHEIMDTLLALLHQKGISLKQRASVMSALLRILDFESKDTILKVAAQYKAVVAMESKPEGQVVMMDVLHVYYWLCRGYRIFAGSFGLLEYLLGVMLFQKDHGVRLSAAYSIWHIVECCSRLTLRVAAFPNALQVLFELFVSQDMFVADDELQTIAGRILSCVAAVPENRIKFSEIQGIWEGLEAILVKLEGAWRETCNDDKRWNLEKRAREAASMLGNLGLEEDLRDIIALLPGVREGLLFFQLAELARSPDPRSLSYFRSIAALTVLYSSPAVSVSTNLPPLEEVLELAAKLGEGPESKSVLEPSSAQEFCYWSRVVAYSKMGFYVESLLNLDRAQGHLVNVLPELSSRGLLYLEYISVQYGDIPTLMSKCRVLLQAMQGDYAGALQTANTLDDGTQTGVVKRLSGDLQGALDDLNTQAAKMPQFGRQSDELAETLKERGYVKYLMDDETGARNDAELAQQITLMNGREWGPRIFDVEVFDHFNITKLPISYLGFSF